MAVTLSTLILISACSEEQENSNQATDNTTESTNITQDSSSSANKPQEQTELKQSNNQAASAEPEAQQKHLNLPSKQSLENTRATEANHDKNANTLIGSNQKTALVDTNNLSGTSGENNEQTATNSSSSSTENELAKTHEQQSLHSNQDLTSANKPQNGLTTESANTKHNPILAMQDSDAFIYLIAPSKGHCDKQLNYSKTACQAYIKQVTNADDRWYHIIRHYDIKAKHFLDQRIYQRMHSELKQLRSENSLAIKKQYGLN